MVNSCPRGPASSQGVSSSLRGGLGAEVGLDARAVNVGTIWGQVLADLIKASVGR
jgi:hypothetical protein